MCSIIFLACLKHNSLPLGPMQVFIFLKWGVPGLFFFISFVQYSWQLMFNINFADDWIRTADLWYWKRPSNWATTSAPSKPHFLLLNSSVLKFILLTLMTSYLHVPSKLNSVTCPRHKKLGKKLFRHLRPSLEWRWLDATSRRRRRKRRQTSRKTSCDQTTYSSQNVRIFNVPNFAKTFCAENCFFDRERRRWVAATK